MIKKKLKKDVIIAVAILTLTFLSLAFVARNKVNAVIQPPVSIWVDPGLLNFTTSNHHVGDMFNVTVWTNTNFNATYAYVFTWQVTLHYNATILNATRGGLTAGGTSEFFSGHTTFPTLPILYNDNVTAFVKTGETLLGADQKAPDNGSLFWIELQIMSAPTNVTGPLTSLLNVTNVDTYLLGPDLGEVPSTRYNGQYSFAWAPPDTTPPTIGTITRVPSGSVDENQNVTVSVNVTDTESGVKNVTLSYTNGSATWTDVTMSLNSTTNLWDGVIPGYLNGTLVQYNITAFDNAGNKAVTSSFNYTVIPEFMTIMPIVLLIILTATVVAFRKKFNRYL
jgi:hypothetical protein